MMKSVNEKIQELRLKMEERNIDALILPSTDPHQSEYVSDYWKIREYFSGFTGSAGTFVVTATEAKIWTDSRYFLQVEKECEQSEVELGKQKIPHAPEHVEWLCKSLSDEANIGIDFRLFSLSQIEYLRGCCKTKNIALIDLFDLVDQCWENRPALSNHKIVDHPIQFNGESRSSKISRLREQMKKEEVQFYLFSRLDEIAWLFNIRSMDVDFTPLAISYAVVAEERSYLFVELNRIEEEFVLQLKEEGIDVLSYHSVFNYLDEVPSVSRLMTDRDSINFASYNALKCEVLFQDSFGLQKTVKNQIELQNAKKGMVQDGIALTKFMIWFENHIQEHTISEYDLARKLESFRAEQEHYVCQSFDAIVGYKGNGAIIHYRPDELNSSEIKNEGVLLIDSGAQYEFATTDITRTFWLGGAPSMDLKLHYTAVLKGYIQLDNLVFPEGTTGVQIDAFARMHLWQLGLSYGHGTGHGIGSFGMVHEPGQGFATSGATIRGTFPHKASQISTIEPGFYLENKYGIRIENCVVSKEFKKTEFGSFLAFEAITLFPIETSLIDFDSFSNEEKNWLNFYHKKVFEELSPFLNQEETEWLKSKTREI